MNELHRMSADYGCSRACVRGQVRARLRSDLVAAHAEVFLISGDLNSALYTSSRAMHSAVLGLLQVRPTLQWLPIV